MKKYILNFPEMAILRWLFIAIIILRWLLNYAKKCSSLHMYKANLRRSRFVLKIIAMRNMFVGNWKELD